MTRVLLCTPYIQKPGVVSGGVNIWGNNVVKYYKNSGSEVCLIPVSFDRIFNVQVNTGFLSRVFYGIRDYKKSIDNTMTYINKKEVDVLHLCTSAQLSLFKDLYILKKAKCKGVKTAIHFHFGRIPEVVSKNNWEGKMILKICQNADIVIVMDNKSFQCLQELGYKNIHYLPNPLSTDIIDEIDSEAARIPRCPNRILYVGHVIPNKGVYELVEACADIDDIELHLVGTIDNKVSSDLVNIARKRGSADWLKIRGGIPHSEVIREMLTARYFVLPSYTEGFPNVILESMAASCVILATNVGAIPEMLNFRSKDPCGIELQPQDVDSIRRNIIEILKAEESIKVFSERAREKVTGTYSMPIVWKQLEDIWLNA